MSATEGHKMYVKAISPLLEELFDCMPDGLFGFLKELSDRADDHDWNKPGLGILQIPEDPADPNTRYDDMLYRRSAWIFSLPHFLQTASSEKLG